MAVWFYRCNVIVGTSSCNFDNLLGYTELNYQQNRMKKVGIALLNYERNTIVVNNEKDVIDSSSIIRIKLQTESVEDIIISVFVRSVM